jgi:hypothetical protein
MSSSDWIIIPTLGENKKCSKSPTSQLIFTPQKNISSSVGMMTYPIYGKIKLMFQTTNQFMTVKPQVSMWQIHASVANILSRLP